MRFLAGLSEIADSFDALLLDLWGVVHNGRRPYPGVVDCLAALSKQGKRVIFLSNAPRPHTEIYGQLATIGIPRPLYESVVTSGDAAVVALTRRSDPDHADLGRRFYMLGPERDRPVLALIAGEEVQSAEAADYVLCTGLFDDERETAADYRDTLAGMLRRATPLLCLNPDLSVIRGEREIPCAGALAEAYARIGGKVVMHGKPFPGIYRLAEEKLTKVDTGRILAVGDRLDTDIAGAKRVGLAAALVTGGVLAAELGVGYGVPADAARLSAVVAKADAKPDFVLPGLAW
ncbi:MAG: TIGR01459 family HAD-type hydrolase [Alphaproteobacteria bacterium]|nr:TIGR01459 family HAD-type hydrolase [Alphaproteobacteria bacterium]